MRDSFMKSLVEAANQNSDIVLLIGDLGYSVVEEFFDKFPDRSFNAGIAEQNMMGMAAGLASEGLHVFTYSIGNFPTFRCAEQIRNDVDYHNLKVTNVVVGGGLSYGSLGYSHHAIQDYALMRIFPNMLIASPGDPHEVRSVMKFIYNYQGPSYLRLGKSGEKNIHNKEPVVSPGQWLKIVQGQDRIILTTGTTLDIGLNLLKSKYKGYGLYSLPLWSMKSKKYQLEQIRQFSEVVTLEDHLEDGGFGSWLKESLGSYSNTKIESLFLDPKVCGEVGTKDALMRLGGLL